MPLALAVIGMGAMAGGTAMQIAGDRKAQQSIDKARSNYVAQQKSLSDQNMALARKSMAGSTADVAEKQIAAGQAQRNSIWEKLQESTVPVASALPATGTGGNVSGAAADTWNKLNANAKARMGGYGDWETDQAVKNADVSQEIGMNNNFAEGNTRLLPSQLEQASHAGDRLSGWGNIVSQLGNMAMLAAPFTASAAAAPAGASTGSMTIAGGGVPATGGAAGAASGIPQEWTASNMPVWSKIF